MPFFIYAIFYTYKALVSLIMPTNIKAFTNGQKAFTNGQKALVSGQKALVSGQKALVKSSFAPESVLCEHPTA